MLLYILHWYGSAHRPDPSRWVDDFDLLRIYIDKPQRKMILLKYKRYYNPCYKKWAIPARHVGSGRGTGWLCYVKYLLVINPLHMHTAAGLRHWHKVQASKLLVGTVPYWVNIGIWNNRVKMCIGNSVNASLIMAIWIMFCELWKSRFYQMNLFRWVVHNSFSATVSFSKQPR